MQTRSVQLNLPKGRAIDIEFEKIYYKVASSRRGQLKTILKGASGRFKSGELTAIMGPSGAGKSTLLNILTGFVRYRCTGKIEYVGNGGKHTWNEYRKESCYIQQDDRLNPLFTVLEMMKMAANLKIGSGLSRKAKEMLIDDILDSLDLTKTRNTRCSQLSGGQKKRLSIALELIDNPPVMFLDEPTTGLDALSSYQCVKVLQDLTKSGRTIVCTIHQPSAAIYEMFDHIYLLADGRCMYQGAPKSTVQYLSSAGLQCPKYHNPADYIIEVISGEYGDVNDQLAKIADAGRDDWRSNTSNDSEKISIDNAKATILITPPSEYKKFWILLNRSAIQLYRDWTVTHLKLVLHIMVGIFLGLIFGDAGNNGSRVISNVGFFLVNIVYLVYTSMMPAVLKFPSEIQMLKKERFNNWYQLRTYYAAALLCSMPLQVLFAVLHTSFSYFLSNQPLDLHRYLMFVGISVLSTLVSESYGLMVGTIFDTINGTFVGAISTCVLLMFGGFLVLFQHMPIVMWYVSYFSYVRYALHAEVQAIYGFNREKLPCPKSDIYCHYRMPKSVMQQFSMDTGKYWIDILIMVIYLIVLRIITYCTLKRKLAIAS